MDVDWPHWKSISDLVDSGQNRQALDQLAAHHARHSDLPAIYVVLKAKSLNSVFTDELGPAASGRQLLLRHHP